MFFLVFYHVLSPCFYHLSWFYHFGIWFCIERSTTKAARDCVTKPWMLTPEQRYVIRIRIITRGSISLSHEAPTCKTNRSNDVKLKLFYSPWAQRSPPRCHARTPRNHPHRRPTASPGGDVGPAWGLRKRNRIGRSWEMKDTSTRILSVEVRWATVMHFCRAISHVHVLFCCK